MTKFSKILMMTCFIIIILYWGKIVNTILWQYKFHVFMMYTSTCVSRKQFLGTVLLMSQSVLSKKCCKDLTPLIFVKIRYKIKNIKYLFGCFLLNLTSDDLTVSECSEWWGHEFSSLVSWRFKLTLLEEATMENQAVLQIFSYRRLNLLEEVLFEPVNLLFSNY